MFARLLQRSIVSTSTAASRQSSVLLKHTALVPIVCTRLLPTMLATGSRENGREMRDKAYEICKDFLSGSWKKISSSDMVFKPISGGLSNILFLCSLPSTHTPLNGEPSQVLLRMYGQLHGNGNGGDTSTITDSVIFMLLSERKLGPKLYGIFPGGRLEEYIPARAMTCEELKDPTLSGIIARKMANVHTLDVPINKAPTWLFETMESWLEAIRSEEPSSCDMRDFRKRETIKELLDFDFESELNWLKDFLKQCKSPVVFCHNDMQEGNILLPDITAAKKPITKKQAYTDDRVVLIDFEYCSYNYRGFDVANHFCEWAFEYANPKYPHFTANLSHYPNKRQRLHFVNEYIKQAEKQRLAVGGDVEPRNTAEHILMEADCFTLASHLLWTLWSINNAFNSEITFGYWEYGKVRLNAYLKHKHSHLSLS